MNWIQALMKPSAYPHPVGEIRHLHTHISDVFLTGPFAYKIKKAVDLKFLDYSTLEKRRYFCEREAVLNRRLAPEIYLGVVPILREGDRVRVGGQAVPEGDPRVVDYAVKMVEFPQQGLLDAVAERGELTRAAILALAGRIARFHRAAERADAFGTPKAVGVNVLRNFEQTAKYQGIVVAPERFTRLKDYSERFLNDRAALFQRRMDGGGIRVCHGDLHLQNICLDRGRLIVFDCIEFNEALSHIDVINETAFLLMDLDHRRLSGLGNRFFNRYLDDLQDYEGLRMLDFYLVYRACVRAKVACFLLDDPDLPDAERASAKNRAAEYFAQAEGYTAPRGRSGLVLMAGVSGSGKSTIAADLAEAIGGVVIRSDALRKSLAGLLPDEREPAAGARGLYTDAMTAKTYAGLLERAGPVVESGRWAILDATYARREFRREAFQWAAPRNLPFAILHCAAPVPLMEERLLRRAAEGRDASDADIRIMRRQIETFDPFDILENRWVGAIRTEQEWSGARLSVELSRLTQAQYS